MAAEAISGSLESELIRALVRIERLRVTIFAGVLLGLIACTLLLIPLFPAGYHMLLATHAKRTVVAAVFAFALAYQLVGRWWLGRLLVSGSCPQGRLRYLTALVETTLPTAALAVDAETLDPDVLLGLPASIYYVLIILSTLSLRFGVCLFTGLAAALQYLAIVWLVIDPRLPAPSTYDTPLPLEVEKCIILALSGLVAGLVTVQVRRLVVRLVQVKEARRRVLDIFGRHVSPQVADHLLSREVELGGETRHVCVMFLDIRDFTHYSSTKRPEEVMRHLNYLFAFMIESINRHQGIVNKFLGDGFLAFFGAPLSDGQDSQHAVAAARDILARLDEQNRGAETPTRVGIGLHAGDAVAGTVGSATRGEYTLIGDTVNVASRVEQLNKQFNSQLLITEDVHREIGGDAAATCLGEVPVKGKNLPVKVYRLA